MKTMSAIVLLVLAGCAPTTIYKPVQVQTPVPVMCKIPQVSAPALPTKNITEKNSMFEQTRALLAENKVRQGYEAMLVASMKACQ